MEMGRWVEGQRDEFGISRWVGGHNARDMDVEKGG